MHAKGLFMSSDMFSHMTDNMVSNGDTTPRVCGTCHFYDRIDDSRGKCKKHSAVVLDGYIDATNKIAMGFWPGVGFNEGSCGEYQMEWELGDL